MVYVAKGSSLLVTEHLQGQDGLFSQLDEGVYGCQGKDLELPGLFELEFPFVFIDQHHELQHLTSRQRLKLDVANVIILPLHESPLVSDLELRSFLVSLIVLGLVVE